MNISIGAAQFGMKYGVSNKNPGPLDLQECGRILRYAEMMGVHYLDSAMSYGVSEEVLGQVGTNGWEVTSKIPKIPQECKSISNWLNSIIRDSLGKLKKNQLEAILLHHPADLLGDRGTDLYQAMQNLRDKNIVKKIGISIYNPDELTKILPFFDIQVVQAPFNVIDTRLQTSGWMEKLATMGIELEIRSIFLQGLLLMNEGRPDYFAKWDDLLSKWHYWLKVNGLEPIEACLGFANTYDNIKKIIVGIDSLQQLEEIMGFVRLENKFSLIQKDFFSSSDIDLINPSMWKLK